MYSHVQNQSLWRIQSGSISITERTTATHIIWSPCWTLQRIGVRAAFRGFANSLTYSLRVYLWKISVFLDTKHYWSVHSLRKSNLYQLHNWSNAPPACLMRDTRATNRLNIQMLILYASASLMHTEIQPVIPVTNSLSTEQYSGQNPWSKISVL